MPSELAVLLFERKRLARLINAAKKLILEHRRQIFAARIEPNFARKKRIILFSQWDLRMQIDIENCGSLPPAESRRQIQKIRNATSARKREFDDEQQLFEERLRVESGRSALILPRLKSELARFEEIFADLSFLGPLEEKKKKNRGPAGGKTENKSGSAPRG